MIVNTLFSTKNHINLDCVPVISNTGYDKESQGKFLQYEIYYSVKEDRACFDLLKIFWSIRPHIWRTSGSYYSISDRRTLYSINKLECRRNQIDKTKYKS